MNHWLRDTPSTLEALITLAIFVSLYMLSKRNLIKNIKSDNRLIWYGCLIYCMFAFCDGDYFHYKQYYIDFKSGETIWSLEDIYLFLLDWAPTYTIFRIFVWGSALYLLYRTAIRLNIWNSTFVFCFITFSIILFSYARVSLAVACAVYGLSLIIKPSSYRFISIILGTFFLISSLCFHKSMIIILALVPLSFIPIGKKTFWLLILCIPILIYLINNYFISYIFNIELGEDQQNAVSSYIIKGNYNDEKGPARIMLDILAQIPAYLGLIFMGNQLKRLSAHKWFTYLFKWSFLIMLCATAFIAFPYSRVLYYRIMFMGRIPEMVCMSFAITQYKNKKSTIISLFFMSAVAYDLAKMAYSAYLSIVQ